MFCSNVGDVRDRIYNSVPIVELPLEKLLGKRDAYPLGYSIATLCSFLYILMELYHNFL